MESYHPKRRDREITDQAEIEALLLKGKFATIAMASGDAPYLVTLSYGYDAAARSLYFHCATAGEKLEFLKRNGRVCATVIDDRGYLPGQCEHAYASLVLRGILTVVDDLEGKKHGLSTLLERLEADPAPILARNIKDDRSYDKVVILRLAIESVAGKKNA